MDVIIYTSEDGSLCRVVPYYKGGFNCQTEMKVVPELNDDPEDNTKVEHKILDNSLMPSSILRNAWKLNSGVVDIDMVKGKTVAHEYRRNKRTEMLEANTAILTKNGAGIPLAPSENAATAASENAAYMSDVDDVAQISIDNATNEADLLAVIEIL